MNMSLIASDLEKVISNSPVVYLTCTPDIGDFTKDSSSKVCIYGKTHSLEFVLKDIPPGRFASLFTLIARRLEKTIIITWDIKKLFSYLRFRWPYSNSLRLPNVMDLKYSESFAGFYKAKPNSYSEAMVRLKLVSKGSFWDIYKRVHLPLATRVLPKLETKGLFNSEDKKVCYVNYELETSANGRMACPLPGNSFFNPHGLTEQLRSAIRRRGEDNYAYIELDFRHMEVNVLQWLTGDPTLKTLVEGHQDVYEGIYSILVGEPCKTKHQREFAKSIFLPVMFGQQAHGLASRKHIDLSDGFKLIEKINKNFPIACKWLNDKEKELEIDAWGTDFFGRRRDFSNVPFLKRRNFEVQSPASIICLEKLVLLYDKLGEHFLFHIHDAYVLACLAKDLKTVIHEATEVLQSKSDLCEGLNLSVGCKVGLNLSCLKKYPL